MGPISPTGPNSEATTISTKTPWSTFTDQDGDSLASSGADLLACETIPSRHEARALRRLLEETQDDAGLVQLQLSGRATSRVTVAPLTDVIEELDDCPQIVAIGVNCTAPRHISGLLRAASDATSKPIVVYPNAGEGWDATTKRWTPVDRDSPTLVGSCREWVDLGARLIGGCCRTSPDDIRQVRRTLLGSESWSKRTIVGIAAVGPPGLSHLSWSLGLLGS